MFFAKRISKSLLLCLITLEAAQASDGPAEVPRGRWTDSSSGSVSLVSAMPADQANEALDQLHQLFELLETFADEPQNEIVILAFDQHRTFSRYAPFDDARGVGGWFQNDDSTSYLGIDRSLRGSWRQTLLHEAVHATLHHRVEPLPLWLEEGVAEFFSTLETRNGQVQIGRPIERHLKLLRSHRWLPWHDVFAMTADSPKYDARLEGQLFYAQSWLLIHHLMVDPERSSRLHQLLEDHDNSALRVADLSLQPERLRVVLRRWVWSPQLPFLRLPRRQAEAAAERNPLSEAALLARLGHLLASRSGTTATLARRHFEAALQLEPEQRMALDGMARLGAASAIRD